MIAISFVFLSISIPIIITTVVVFLFFFFYENDFIKTFVNADYKVSRFYKNKLQRTKKIKFKFSIQVYGLVALQSFASFF